MTAHIRHITFDCADPYALARFWSEVTGYREDPDNPNAPGDPEALLVAPDGGPGLLFIPVTEGKPGEPRTGFMSGVGVGPGVRRCALSTVVRSGSSLGRFTFL